MTFEPKDESVFAVVQNLTPGEIHELAFDRVIQLLQVGEPISSHLEIAATLKSMTKHRENKKRITRENRCFTIDSKR